MFKTSFRRRNEVQYKGEASFVGFILNSIFYSYIPYRSALFKLFFPDILAFDALYPCYTSWYNNQSVLIGFPSHHLCPLAPDVTLLINFIEGAYTSQLHFSVHFLKSPNFSFPQPRPSEYPNSSLGPEYPSTAPTTEE